MKRCAWGHPGAFMDIPESVKIYVALNTKSVTERINCMLVSYAINSCKCMHNAGCGRLLPR
jgi:hypothetical protein